MQQFVIVMLLLAGTVSAAEARQDQRQAGPVVHVTATSGALTKGRLLALTPATVSLLVDGRRHDQPLAGVLQIERPSDPRGNGAAIGALVGAIYCALVCAQGANSAGAGIASGIVVGGLIGFGIDAARSNRAILYPVQLPATAHVAPSLRLRFSF